MSQRKNLVICGGGNGGHVLAGLASVSPSADVTVLDHRKNSAEQLLKIVKSHGLRLKYRNGNDFYLNPNEVKFNVTYEPEKCVPEADMVIFCVPAFAHENYINLMIPYLKPGCILVGMPGHPGFEYMCVSMLRKLGKPFVIVNLETLPWSCRIASYGREVNVIGSKKEVMCSLVYCNSKIPGVDLKVDPLKEIEKLIGPIPVLRKAGSPLECAMMSNFILNPPIMYSKWSRWDGEPLEEPPLLYRTADQMTADCLDNAKNEIIKISEELRKRYPKLGLQKIGTMREWLVERYGYQIEDCSTLFTCLRTNRAYVGITHPMVKTADGRFVPDFGHRFLTEDVPYGLLVLKEVATMLDVETPVMDEIICWTQSKLQVKLMKDGKLCDVDRQHVRRLALYGIRSADALVHFFDE